jgi:DNA-binding MarR family transcriptional regulator
VSALCRSVILSIAHVYIDSTLLVWQYTAMSSATGSALNEVIAAAYRLHADIVAVGDAVAARYGLTAARWQVFGAVALGCDVTVPDLARSIGTARQSVQRIVSELVSEGLLQLKDNPRHRRAKLVVMTTGGRRSYDAVMAAWAPNAIALEQGIGSEAASHLARDMLSLATAFRTIAARSGEYSHDSEETISSSIREQRP